MELKKLFFFDAEWVPIAKDWNELQEKFPEHANAWLNRCKKWNDQRQRNEQEIKQPETFWEDDAGFNAEFSKIICISFGYLNKDNEFIVRSSYGHDEFDLLNNFNNLLESVSSKNYILSGYAIKRYDMPWIAKRMMINGISPSKMLNVYGKKPWEVNVFDLPEVWGQGNLQESYTPFDTVLTSLGIETSKDDISGANVKTVYYVNNDLERIKTYCEKDVKKSYELAKKLISLS